MSANVSVRQIANGMLAALQPRLITSAPPAAGAYLRHLDWHAGEFSSAEAMASSGISGRCPAALVDFAGQSVLRTVVSARAQFVESTFLVICASDSMRSRQDREEVGLDQIFEDVREQLHGRRLGLPISPLHYAGLLLVAQQPALMAYALRFTSRHHLVFGDEVTTPLEKVSGSLTASTGSTELPVEVTP